MKIGKGEKVRPFEMAHINFHTARLEDMKSWYITVLEAKAVYADGNYAFLSYDEDFHRIALIRDSRLGDKSGLEASADHAAFAYASLEELVYTFERLRNLNILPDRVINHGPTISLYYLDPDGNHLELQVNRFGSMDEIKEFLKKGTFAVDPIGVEFNIDLFIEKLQSGVSTNELFRTTSAGELSSL
ncbi:MAG: biphenyl 2,3-dioxygenase [Nitrospinaceae bacterium]|jgi:catechol-2,3-dioxygenase|nr:biphenyl 2,3-dioxygenase [Nitrospinaceae bacterium]MBT4432627.1 biphenyl 2,3-dioxygenase [Nitrospinaceae bacterium]